MDSLHTCQDCGLSVALNTPLTQAHKCLCPRCNATLYYYHPQFIQQALALSLSTLLLFAPSIFLPILTFEAFGQHSNASLYDGASALFESGFYLIALLVAACGFILPVLQLLIIIYVSSHLLASKTLSHQHSIIGFYDIVKEWSVPQVYLLAILIAYIKMGDLGNIGFGMAVVLFIISILLFIRVQVLFDAKIIDHAFSRLKDKSN